MIRTELIASQEFDQYAGDYDRMLAEGLAVSGEGKDYFALRRILWLKTCLDELQLAPRRIMDYGCGTGAAVSLLLEQFKAESVMGIDPSAKLIERAKHDYGSGRTIFQQIQEYRPEEESDLVYCNGVFHHIPAAKRWSALQQIWKALQPGGFLAFWENNPWNPGTRYIMNRIPFDRDAVTLTASEACRLLQAAGFHIVRTNYLFIFPRFLRALRWIEPRLCQFPFGGQYLVLARKSGKMSRCA